MQRRVQGRAQDRRLGQQLDQRRAVRPREDAVNQGGVRPIVVADSVVGFHDLRPDPRKGGEYERAHAARFGISGGAPWVWIIGGA